jgi:signal transduction histidine kinase/tetratricopeptide (TPR) repeat protein
MKILTRGIFSKKKILLIFLIAILLPAFVIGYLSLSTIANRREAMLRLLESNLWVSGDAAIKSVENSLLEYEGNALTPEHFLRINESDEPEPNLIALREISEDIKGRPFLLDSDFELLAPKVGYEESSYSQWDTSSPNLSFNRSLERAEHYEFSQKNYSQAAEYYRRCVRSAHSAQSEALAWAGLGRSLLRLKQYNQAQVIYEDLITRFGQLQNKTGHPYGLTAGLNLSSIKKLRNKDEESLQDLLMLYDGMKKGRWLVTLSSYDFFMGEIESQLDDGLSTGKFPGITEEYDSIKKQDSTYLGILEFADFLNRMVIPRIEERMSVVQTQDNVRSDRIIATLGEEFCLISYTTLLGFQSGTDNYGGFCWDLEYVKDKLVPEQLEKISEESGLCIHFVQDGISENSEEIKTSTSKDSITLSLREFPIPWKFIVTQPAFDDLERSARRENIIYGTLLVVIVVLMLLGAFLIVRDISRESETTRVKTEFVHNISHELKTPLTLIRLYSETLQRKEKLPEKEKQDAYEIITKESERLSHLINNVLDFSQIEMGRKEFNFKTGNLAKIIKDTLESYRYHLEKKGFNVTLEIASDIPEMDFDEEAISSVLINLLSNAMKFSPKIKEVTVRLYGDGKKAILEVKDKGIGIAPMDLLRIFDRFYRCEHEVVSETRGSGLGLTLVRHIVEAHGGTVDVKSIPDKGSVFTVILPFSGPIRG